MPSAAIIRVQIESTLAQRVPAALTLKIKQKPEVFATTKSGKKKRKFAKALKDAIWLYLAGAGLLALTLFLGYVTFRPGAILGRSLTFDEVAGTYVSEQHPGLKIILGTDGTWGVEDQSQGGDLRIDGLVYSIKGRKIVCDEAFAHFGDGH